jgi:hypothetical protein
MVLGWAAGCVTTEPKREPDLRLTAAWQPWADDPIPHLIVNVHNRGTAPADIGPGAFELRIVGPGLAGETVWPMAWGDSGFARPLAPQNSVTLPMHPRMGLDGRMGFAIDHMWGDAFVPPPGKYSICIETSCTEATLVSP